jgi:hypothetical protein
MFVKDSEITDDILPSKYVKSIETFMNAFEVRLY